MARSNKSGGSSATSSSSTTDIVYVRKVVRKDLLSKDGGVFLNRNNEFIFATVSGITDTSYKFLVRDGDDDDTEETVDIRFDSEEEIVVVYNAKVLPSRKEIDIVEVNINPEANLLATPVYAMTSGDGEIPQFEEVKSIKSTKDETVFLCKLSGKRKSVKVSTVFIGVNVVDDSDDEDEEKEPTLEDGAKSGCKRCKNELETGKKTSAKHTPSCPHSKQSKTAREEKKKKKKSQKKTRSNNKDDDYSDDEESVEVINRGSRTRAQRATNRNNNSTGGNNLGRGNKNSRPREESPTSNSSRNRTNNPAAKRQRNQTGGGKRLSNNNIGGATAAATAAPPVISISNGENTPRNNQNGFTSHGIGSGQGGGGAGLVDSTLSGSISTSNSGSSTMDLPPNPNNKLFVEIDQGSVSDNGQPVRKCWVNMATGEVRTIRPSPGELQARLGPPTQVSAPPMQQQSQTNMMMPPQQFDMGEMMQMQMMMMMMNQQQNQQQMLQQQQQQMLQQNQQQQQQQQQPQVPGLMSLLGSIFSWVCS